MESEHPRRPRAAIDDDALAGVPPLDGALADVPLETAIDLDVRDDEASALDDSSASDLPGASDEPDDLAEGSVRDEDELAPLEADPSLASGEGERWTEGSDAADDGAWQEDAWAEPTESALDRGEEGFDEAASSFADALPGLPPARVGDSDDDIADELDVSEASSIEISGAEPATPPPLARLELAVGWHGPAGQAVRAVAVADAEVVVAARTLWMLTAPPRAFPVVSDAEVSAVLVEHETRTLLIATDAGDVWRVNDAGDAERMRRPGTDDASLGGLDLASVGGAVVARTRGGALFRLREEVWVGPIVARNVRRVRSALGVVPDWLMLVVGSAETPELLATRDAHTFERVLTPRERAVAEAARSGDTIAVACTDGALLVSRDAGASYVLAEHVVDVERVWVSPRGIVYAASFHEATDHGRLVRVDGDRAEVILDVEREVSVRRISGPGEHDGDGRIHALALGDGVLWVATGVGAFSIDAIEPRSAESLRGLERPRTP